VLNITNVVMIHRNRSWDQEEGNLQI